jgi:hypothetical protein
MSMTSGGGSGSGSGSSGGGVGIGGWTGAPDEKKTKTGVGAPVARKATPNNTVNVANVTKKDGKPAPSTFAAPKVATASVGAWAVPPPPARANDQAKKPAAEPAKPAAEAAKPPAANAAGTR